MLLAFGLCRTFCALKDVILFDFSQLADEQIRSVSFVNLRGRARPCLSSHRSLCNVGTL